MAIFCRDCGAELAMTSKFCPSCGTTRNPAPQFTPEKVLPEPRRGSRSIALWAGLVLSVALAAGAGAWVGGLFDRSPSPSEALAGPADPGAATDPGSRPPEWFANYKDKFLSGDIIVYTIGKAEMRNFPTASGTMSLKTLEPGTMLLGRWVEGGDAESKWLKTRDEGYVWSGNLASKPKFPELRSDFVTVLVSNVRLGRSIVDGQIADLVDDATFRERPATVVVQFDFARATPGQSYSCVLRNQDGLVSSFDSRFGDEAGWVWCRFPNLTPGPYDLTVVSQGAAYWLSSFLVMGSPSQSAAADAAAAP